MSRSALVVLLVVAGLVAACSRASQQVGHPPQDSDAGKTVPTAGPGPTATPPTGQPAPGPVPFDEVGAGWLLVLRSAGDTDVAGGGSPRLLVIAPDGATYEPTVDRTDAPISAILDWRPDGREAMVRVGDPAQGRVARISLEDGTVRPLDTDVVDAGFTRPTGGDTVVEVRRGAEQWIELRNGTPVSTEHQPADSYGLPWLYGLDGTTLVVGDRFPVGQTFGHLTLYRNDGTQLAQLDPSRTSCRPVRWWTAEALLAACDQRGGAPAFSRLWLVPRDGGRPLALTPAADAAPAGAERGFTDARWATPDLLVLQGEGADGPALFSRQTDGSVTPLDLGATPGSARLVDAGNGSLVLWYPTAAADPLVRVGVDGSDRRPLLEPAPGPGGVLDAVAAGWGPATAMDDTTAVLDPPPAYEYPGGRVCPGIDEERFPTGLDTDGDGRVERVVLAPQSSPPGPTVEAQVQETGGAGAVTVLASATGEVVDAVTHTSDWYGDIDGDGHSEAVLCVQSASGGGGYPFTTLFVFTRVGAQWTTALAQLRDGSPVELDARVDGLAGTFENFYVAAICRETIARRYTWQGGALVLSSEQVLSRTQTEPDVDCPWPSR